MESRSSLSTESTAPLLSLRTLLGTMPWPLLGLLLLRLAPCPSSNNAAFAACTYPAGGEGERSLPVWLMPSASDPSPVSPLPSLLCLCDVEVLISTDDGGLLSEKAPPWGPSSSSSTPRTCPELWADSNASSAAAATAAPPKLECVERTSLRRKEVRCPLEARFHSTSSDTDEILALPRRKGVVQEHLKQ